MDHDIFDDLVMQMEVLECGLEVIIIGLEVEAEPVTRICSRRHHEMNYSKFKIVALKFSAQDSHLVRPALTTPGSSN